MAISKFEQEQNLSNPEETVLQEPILIEFLSLKPDEELRINRLNKPGLEFPTVELIKLETPLGTDDVAMSGYTTVTDIALQDAIKYLKRDDIKGSSDIEWKRLYAVTIQIMLIQEAFNRTSGTK